MEDSGLKCMQWTTAIAAVAHFPWALLLTNTIGTFVTNLPWSRGSGREAAWNHWIAYFLNWLAMVQKGSKGKQCKSCPSYLIHVLWGNKDLVLSICELEVCTHESVSYVNTWMNSKFCSIPSYTQPSFSLSTGDWGTKLTDFHACSLCIPCGLVVKSFAPLTSLQSFPAGLRASSEQSLTGSWSKSAFLVNDLASLSVSFIFPCLC